LKRCLKTGFVLCAGPARICLKRNEGMINGLGEYHVQFHIDHLCEIKEALTMNNYNIAVDRKLSSILWKGCLMVMVLLVLPVRNFFRTG
jgi:hypothetical protein